MPSSFSLQNNLLQAVGLFSVLCLNACSDFRVPALDKLKEKESETSSVQAGQIEGKGKKLTTEKEDEVAKKKLDTSAVVGTAPSVDLSFLLSMNFDEAKTISAQSMELPKGIRLAADSIVILKKGRDDEPKRLRAKGKVYLEYGEGNDTCKVLCQEAYINFNEIVLRGKPIIQRGGSIVEGLEDLTVAHILGARLRVIGLHRVTNSNSMLAMMPDLGPWTGGPNLILPPLSEDAVPSNVRDEMFKAAEAESVLQQNRADAFRQPAAPAAPWIKDESKAKAPPAEKKPAVESGKPVQIKSA